MKYSLCSPYEQFNCNCTACILVSGIDSHVFCFFLSYGLFARRYIVFDVCIFKKTKDDYICVLSVPLSGSVGWTCLSAAIFRPGFLTCSAPGHDDPLGTLPSSPEGH